MPVFQRLPRVLSALAVWLAVPLAASAAVDDTFGRVGRIVSLQGDVSFFDPDRDEWTEALRNRPVTTGDRLVLARGARAELRVGGAVLLLSGATDVEVLRLDDDHLKLELHRGSLALRLPSRDLAEQTELRTRETLLRPQRAGQYRVDRDDESTFAAVMRGALEASGHGHLLLIDSGERHEIWRDDRRDTARSRITRMPDDRLAAWAEENFRDEDRRAEAWRYASPDIPGIEELDGHGRWEQHPDYGAVWSPIRVSAGWTPFRDGRWVWMRPWGWTWVDAQPWGFAPAHYGRWVQWHGRWAWWPGARHARPVFAPAVVAWVGGPNVGVSVNIGIGHAPPVSWVPLRPYQPYVPIVVPRPHHHPKPPPVREPVMRPGVGAPGVTYGPQGVPNNVQAVPAARPAPVARPTATPAAAQPVTVSPRAAQVQTQPQVPPQLQAQPQPQPQPQPPATRPVPAPAAPQAQAPKPERSDSRADQRRRDQTQ
ncbi:MAG: hypothetical protein IV093_12535 [Rubrivivax sp.]|nr:hypothetical protein [Rubrivivax sp.]